MRQCWFTRLLPILMAMILAGLVGPVFAAAPGDSAILFIGDGMGPAQIQITRAASGGDRLRMETLPFAGFATTNSAEGKVTDSAAAGTALATGHKTKNGMIGVDPEGRRLTSILERAQSMYKATGIITTDALWGATPASFAAHVDSRGKYAEIAAQMAACHADVMMGYWKDQFLPQSIGGKRTDGRDLLAEMRRAGYDLVYTRDELKAARGHRLVGLFDDGAEAPSLSDMVNSAVERLSQNPNGFFLIVEGARIDWSGHVNDPAGVVVALRDLDAAVATATDLARRRGKTLIVVAADHETGGPAVADAKKLGALAHVKMSSGEMAEKLSKTRDNIADVLAQDAGITDPTPAEIAEIQKADDAGAAIAKVLSTRAGVTWASEGHTATRVRVFAFGPGADRFSGDLDNTDIPKRIAASIGIGPL